MTSTNHLLHERGVRLGEGGGNIIGGGEVFAAKFHCKDGFAAVGLVLAKYMDYLRSYCPK